MSKKKKQKKPDEKSSKKGIVDIKKLKSYGITKDIYIVEDEIEKIEGEDINGGKDTNPTTTVVCQQWPTTGA